MAGFSEWLFGSPDKLNKVPTGTEQQEGLHNNILSQAMNMSQNGGGYNNAQNYYNQLLGPNQQQAYDQFSQPYMQQFQEQILPMIAERFAGAGALSSSGFGQALGGAGAGLQGQLAKLFSQLQSEAASNQTNQFNQLSQTGLNHQPFAYNQEEGSGGFLRNILGGLSGAIGGPLGSALGSGIGNGISSLFKSKQQSNNAGLTSRGINELFRRIESGGIS
jgi:hypothetical protein